MKRKKKIKLSPKKIRGLTAVWLKIGAFWRHISHRQYSLLSFQPRFAFGRKSRNIRLSTPENNFFGLFVAASLAFALLVHSTAHAKFWEFNPPVLNKPLSKTDKNISRLIRDYPMKKMTPYLTEENDKVAAYLVAIGKKESNWGKFSPRKNGRDCFNYWGYRGSENPTQSGYSCFSSPKQAVKIVGDRIGDLLSQKIDTPREMLVWKCGGTCFGATSHGAARWVRDVDYYYEKIYEPKSPRKFSASPDLKQ